MKNNPLSKYTQEKSKRIVGDIRTSNFSDFDFLKQDFNHNKVILIGSWHGIKEMEDLFVKIVMYLNQFGYKDIILEKPLASEYYYGKYVDTGEEKYWPGYFDPGPFKILHNWNRTLPKSQKIRIWCIDVDQNYIATSMCLNEYIKALKNRKLKDKILRYWNAFEQIFLNTIIECLNQNPSKEACYPIISPEKSKGINADVKQVMMHLSKWFRSISENDIKCFLQNMTKSLAHHKKTRLDYLFRVEDIFKRRKEGLISDTGRVSYERSFRILEALRGTIKMESDATSSHDFICRREEFLKNCAERVFKLREEGKFIGFFGSWHIAKSSVDGVERLGEYIAKKFGRNRVHSLYLAIHNGVMCNSFTGKTYTIPAVKGFEGTLANAVGYNCFFLPIEESFFKKYKFLARFGQKISHEAYDGCIFIRETHKPQYSFL